MRLTENEIKAIKNSILSEDKKAKIYLFGSRVVDDKKGGDIDILILSRKLDFSNVLSIKKKIFDNLEEQKIDIVIGKNLKSPFVKIAYKKGIKL
jgi:uncharacterized protein